MVLFREDEQRMKEMERQERLSKRTRLGNIFRLSFKIFLVIGGIFTFGLWLLAMLGGDNDALKKGIEDYMTQVTGMRAQVSRFEGMTFFPDLGIDMGGLSFRSGDQTLAAVDSLRFRAGFFDMMFSRRTFEALDIEGLDLKAGLTGADAVVLDRLAFVSATDKAPAGLIANGKYAGNPVMARAVITHERSGETDFFTLPARKDFEIVIATGDAGQAKNIELLLKKIIPAEYYGGIRVISCGEGNMPQDDALCRDLMENPASAP